jgi:hypothetical protein
MQLLSASSGKVIIQLLGHAKRPSKRSSFFFYSARSSPKMAHTATFDPIVDIQNIRSLSIINSDQESMGVLTEHE